MSTQRLFVAGITLILVGLCLTPANVWAKKTKPPPSDDPPCERDIWAGTPNLYETEDNGDDTTLRLTLPASGEITVARFQISSSDGIKKTISVDGFEFTQFQGTPGDVKYRVYYLNSGLNCYNREVYAADDFLLYGTATPTSGTFAVDKIDTEFTQDLLGSQFCVFVTAENLSGTSGEVFQLGIDYSYTSGTNRWALNADCEKYEDYGLSNDKSFYDYRDDVEGPAPARTFVEFLAP